MKQLFFGFFLVCVLAVLGCGNGNQKLHGKVTFSDDNSPLTAGTVIFNGSNQTLRGDINEKGEYSVEDGLPRGGEYKVSITGAEVQNGTTPDGFPRMVPQIMPKFSNPEQSGLVFTADGKNSKFDIKVDRLK